MHAVDHLIGVGIFKHHHLSKHFLAFAVGGYGTKTGGTAGLNSAYVAYLNDRATAISYHNVAQFLHRTNQTFASDKITLICFFNITATYQAVVAFKGSIYLVDAHIHRFQQIGIQGYLVLFEVAAPGIHFHHTGNAG